ncbi:Nucleotide-binding protein, UspA family [Halapricum desulfuricans]|uniref:Nucleotide-binding protein, UspA family n=1 Tax=Halapricum desulfuricans TaxID=2841257 RepID=A0A897NJR7_9EURY|nr:universal stress protein [Halapricum desulfuricans]QSG12561.1 Nucleotide-binding protein, UspA family [Halapricum desulfuricans]
MYDRILLPTDGSEEIEPVIEHAVELAAHHDATLHALYVLDTASLNSLPMETSWDTISSILEEEGTAALDVIDEYADDVVIERKIVEGSPSRRIVQYAEDEGMDLIVMGTHGRGGIDRLLLGSVAERVVRTSSVPVLTVRVGSA